MRFVRWCGRALAWLGFALVMVLMAAAMNGWWLAPLILQLCEPGIFDSPTK